MLSPDWAENGEVRVIFAILAFLCFAVMYGVAVLAPKSERSVRARRR